MRYSVYSGDPDGWFSVDPESGALRTAARLDHEKHSFVLLNMQAVSGQPPIYGHAQVRGRGHAGVRGGVIAMGSTGVWGSDGARSWSFI